MPLGGRVLGGKWGTPDVLGVYRPVAGDVLTWSPEIISVEVKATTRDTVTAFGQAIAYQLFSTKTYLALPDTITRDDRRELHARCMLHGLGLILFGPTHGERYTLAVPAARRTPDLESARQFVEKVRARAPNQFRELFG